MFEMRCQIVTVVDFTNTELFSRSNPTNNLTLTYQERIWCIKRDLTII